MFLIRMANADDAQRIALINKNEFGYEYPTAKTQEQIKKILLKSSDRIFVVCDNNLVVGYVHACDYEGTYFDPQKNIMAIAVDGSYRGKGLGKMLLSEVEKWSKEENCAGVRLVSGLNREEAHKFYEKCGYRLRKIQKNYIKIF
ncbi:MAG: GNAT family N-acetyltransferase [Eubacteriales bacterium]